MASKSQQRERAIVEAARALFYHQGVSATPIGAVAAEAGLEKGHLTYYFASKRELLGAVASANLSDYEALFEAWSADVQPVLRFIDFIESQAEALATFGCPIGTLCSEVGKSQPEAQVEAAAVLVRLGEWLSEQLRVSLGAERARDLADQLLAQAQGAAVLAHARRDPQVVRAQVTVMRSLVAVT